MTNKNATKRALILSVLSLVLCFSMLIGTTFAWFTDSVSSTNNIITSGNLDVELEYSYDASTWKKVSDQSEIFSAATRWEPGHTEVVYFRVSNVGSLAFKYSFGVNIVDEIAGVNKSGQSFKLSNFIKFGVVDGQNVKFENRAAALAAIKSEKYIHEGYAKNSVLYSEDDKPSDGNSTEYLALVVYMPETVGDEANHNGEDIPSITLGIDVFATQTTFENDSFGNDFDAAAPWVGGVDTSWYFKNPDATEFTLSSPEALAGLAAIVNGYAVAPVTTYAATEPATVQDTFKDKTIKLAADLDLRNIPWTPIGRIGVTSTDFTYSFKGTFDGQGHTIKNLKVTNAGWAGLFGIAHSATINNVKLDGVKLESNRMTGAVVGQLYGSIDNCHVKNAEITVVPNLTGSKFDNGDKVGGIVGWLGDNGNNRTLTNCSATNVTIKAYRDAAGIAGYVASSTTVSKNKASKVDITIDQSVNFYGKKDANVGAIYGRTGGAIEDKNDNEAVEFTSTVVNVITSADELRTALTSGGSYKLAMDLVLNADETITVPAGVTVALDLNGKTIELIEIGTITANQALIKNKGNLTILDTSESQSGKLSYKYNGGTSNWVAAVTLSNEQGTLTIKGGTIESLSLSTNSDGVSTNVYKFAVDNLTNGNGGDAVLNIEGGKITAAKGGAVRGFANSTTNNCVINISGGEIVGQVWMQDPAGNPAKGNKGVLNITGGDFMYNNNTVDVISVDEGMTASITGGKYADFSVLDYVSDGANVIIELRENVNLGNTKVTIPAGAKVALDLNGFDITANKTIDASTGNTAEVFLIETGAALTVKGTGDVTMTTSIVNNTNVSAAIFRNQGTLTISGGSYKAVDESTPVPGAMIIVTIVDTCLYKGHAVTTITGGEYTLGGGAKNIFRNFPTHNVDVSTTLTITGGTFRKNPEQTTTYIWNHQNNASYVSYMNFSGGDFEEGIVYEDYYGHDDIVVANNVIAPYSGNN